MYFELNWKIDCVFNFSPVMAYIRVNTEGCLCLVTYLMCFSFSMFLSRAVDTIRHKDSLRENQTLVSAGGLFELGFFTDESTGNHFLGIWFKDDVNKKAVWVAIRENPILDSSGVLQIRDDGNLTLTGRRYDRSLRDACN